MVSVEKRHQYDATKMYVVVVLSSGVWWLKYENVFSIESSATIYKIPFFLNRSAFSNHSFLLLGNCNKRISKDSGQAITNKEVSATPKFGKRRATSIKSNIQFMEVCQRALEKSSTETTEYEAVGINAEKKLEDIHSSQAVYAESLINIILSKGLLNQLTPNTILSENTQNNTFAGMNIYFSSPSSSSSTSNYSPVDSHIQLSPTAGNSQSSTAQFYEENHSLLKLQQL